MIISAFPPSYQQRSSIVMAADALAIQIRHCLAAGSLATTKNDDNAGTSRFPNPLLHVLHNQSI